MKDIKSLYRAAKTSGKQTDISAYSEAVHEMFESNPNDYISNLEYIIQSDIGLRTLKEFVETHGLPIACYDQVMSVLENCIQKCDELHKDSSAFKEAVTFMEGFHQKYIGCFMMESYFHDKLPDNYVSIYYCKNAAGIPNRKLGAGLINKFAEGAIPDVIITADSLGGNALDTMLSFIESSSVVGNPVTYEWVLECVKNLVPESNPSLALMESKSIGSIVRNVQTRNTSIYRESLITGEDRMMEYSEYELAAFEEYISFNEYKVLWATDLNESFNDIQNTIYSLYQEIAGILNEYGDPFVQEESIADNIVPMLPGSTGVAQPIRERLDVINTRNKKTGEIPGYLKKNHNLGYGEDDADTTHGVVGTEPHEKIEPTLDDFKRPSAIEVDAPYSGLEDEKDKVGDKDTSNMTAAEKQQAINNYYYYTYNNSLNKSTTGSFNKDQSTHTSHRSSIDDHSKNKRVNSANNGVVSSEDDVDGYKPVGEKAKNPWELDVLGGYEVYNEGFKDVVKKIGSRVKSFFIMKKTLKNIQDLDTPAALKLRIPLTIPGTNIQVKLPVTLDKPKLESVEDVYTEDGEAFRLSKYDISNVVKRLRKKFKAEILFVNNSNYTIAQQIGPAGVVETTRETIEKIMRGKTLAKMPSKIFGDEGEFERVIFVNPSIIRGFMISTPEDLEIIISHEYGHVLTYDQITNDEWLEYQAKRSMIASLTQVLYPLDAQALAESNMVYYKLKPEALANKAMNIDPARLLYAFLKRKATGKLDKLDMDGIVNWKIPPSIMKMNMDIMSGKSNPSTQELRESVAISVALYKQVVRDKDTLKLLINSMEQTVKMFEQQLSSRTESVYIEEVGDADDDRPKSDHPIKDTLTDIDRKLVTKQQEVKKGVQNIQNVGRAFTKPAKRTAQWVDNMVSNWKDKDENAVKEKLADPHARSNLFSAIKTSIKTGALFKAGLLLNPVFLVLSASRFLGKNKREFRLRNEMIGELKTELEIIDEKIKDADRVGDNKAKYQLMRFKNEVNKKLLRVGGGPGWKKMI